MNLKFKILPTDQLPFLIYKEALSFDIDKAMLALEGNGFSADNFKFYTSVSVISSSKIEGESLDVDSYVRHKNGRKLSLPVAENIAAEQLILETEDEIFINLEELRNGFIASSHNLYSFIMNYRYPREVSYDEKITIFCQMASIYENEFDVGEQFMSDGEVEYAIVKPK